MNSRRWQMRPRETGAERGRAASPGADSRPGARTGDLFEWLVAQVAGLAAGEYPAADGRDQGHADQDDEQVGDRDRGEDGGQAAVERVGAEPARGADIAAHRAEHGTGETERACGRGGEAAAGSRTRP